LESPLDGGRLKACDSKRKLQSGEINGYLQSMRNLMGSVRDKPLI